MKYWSTAIPRRIRPWRCSESISARFFQDPEEQFFALNVGDEISFPLKKAASVPFEEIGPRVDRAAKRMGIEHLLAQDIHEL